MAVLLSSAYLAPVEYYTKLLTEDVVYIEQCENYNKQSYRNRCTIASPTGEIALSIPIEKPESQKALTRDIRISDHGNWRHLHWYAILSYYNSTPFFEYYQDYFRPFYEEKFEFLFDFNEQLRTMICELIDINPTIKYTDSYEKEFGGQDFRETIHPKKNWREVSQNFEPARYYQVFEQKLGFIPNLSIIDLLFNMGPESLLVLEKSNVEA